MKKEDLKLMFKDYANYIVEKKTFLEDLENNDSILYQKIEDLLIALDHINKKYLASEKLSETEIVLFEIGLEYLFDFIATIKSYDKGTLETKSYIIDLLIDLDDFINDAEEELKVNLSDDLYEELEAYLTNGLELDEKLYLKINELLLQEEYLSILGAFAAYVDELNLV